MSHSQPVSRSIFRPAASPSFHSYVTCTKWQSGHLIVTHQYIKPTYIDHALIECWITPKFTFNSEIYQNPHWIFNLKFRNYNKISRELAWLLYDIVRSTHTTTYCWVLACQTLKLMQRTSAQWLYSLRLRHCQHLKWQKRPQSEFQSKVSAKISTYKKWRVRCRQDW